MKIAKTYSHLNGLEHLLVHKKKLWSDIESAIGAVEFDACRFVRSAKLSAQSQPQYSALYLNRRLGEILRARHWQSRQITHWVTSCGSTAPPARSLSAQAQKREIENAGLKPVRRSISSDFVKDRVAINMPFKASPAPNDLFVKHLAFYVRDQIDVGVEILPMKSLQHHMSSGPGYYEGELYNVIRNGRGVPSVPLVVIGIAP